MAENPALLCGPLQRMKGASNVPQMVAGVEEVDDLYRTREVLAGNVPDPFNAIADDDFLGVASSPFPGFHVQTFSKLFGRLNSSHIGGGCEIANRVSRLIQAGLGEHTTKLDLAVSVW